MTRPNDDLTAEPLDDDALADLEAQLRRDVVTRDRARPALLGLLARCRAVEHALATVRAQPKRDELAHEVTHLARENAGLEVRYAERALAANTAEAYLAQARVRLAEQESEHARVLREHQAQQAADAATRAEILRTHQVDLERVQSVARLREADLKAQLEQSERTRIDARALSARMDGLRLQHVALVQTLDQRRTVARDVRASVDALLTRLEGD